MNWKFSSKIRKNFEWILIFYRQMCQFHLLHDNQKSGNICVLVQILLFLFWPTSGDRSNLKLTYFTINNRYPSKVFKMFELKVHFKNVYMKIITWFLGSSNNNCGNFCPIRSNEVPISSQYNYLSKCHHLFYIFN